MVSEGQLTRKKVTSTLRREIMQELRGSKNKVYRGLEGRKVD